MKTSKAVSHDSGIGMPQMRISINIVYRCSDEVGFHASLRRLDVCSESFVLMRFAAALTTGHHSFSLTFFSNDGSYLLLIFLR